jgi:cytochrome b
VTERVAVWDVPTRLFHWLLVALIGLSWWSAENDRIDLHLWSGIAVLALLLFRLLWGLFGSSTARFASFVRGPRALFDYVRGPGRWNGIGHSPLGALSVIALLGVLAVQVGLGLIISDEDGVFSGPLNQFVSFDVAESARELHETMFNLLLALMALHVAAILFYRLFLGKKLTSAMVAGKAQAPAGTQAMRPARWWAAIACLVAAIAIARWIVAGAPPFGG